MTFLCSFSLTKPPFARALEKAFTCKKDFVVVSYINPLTSNRNQHLISPYFSTLRVKVFAQSPFGNQLFWFRETFLQIKLLAPKF